MAATTFGVWATVDGTGPDARGTTLRAGVIPFGSLLRGATAHDFTGLTAAGAPPASGAQPPTTGQIWPRGNP